VVDFVPKYGNVLVMKINQLSTTKQRLKLALAPEALLAGVLCGRAAIAK